MPEPNVTLPFEEGSGKLGTPFFRMQEANFCMLAPPAIVRLPPPGPLPLRVPAPLDEDDEDDDEFVVVEPATLGDFEGPPQAAAARARTAAAALILSALIRVMRTGIARHR